MPSNYIVDLILETTQSESCHLSIEPTISVKDEQDGLKVWRGTCLKLSG